MTDEELDRLEKESLEFQSMGVNLEFNPLNYFQNNKILALIPMARDALRYKEALELIIKNHEASHMDHKEHCRFFYEVAHEAISRSKGEE